MSETDPFSDAAFISRLNKLLPMLGSAQSGEADAARRKLIDHLASHRLSFTDLAQRLRDLPERGSFLGGARELSLERQLSIARQAKQEAGAEAQAALQRAHMLDVDLQQATFEIGRAMGMLARARSWAAAAWGVAALCLLLALVPHLLPQTGTRQANPNTATGTSQIMVQPPDPFGAAGALRLAHGEASGRAAVQDLAIRLSPSNDAGVRAFLNRGELVVIQQTIHVGAQTWLLIRSATGIGWVRAGDVER